MHDSDWSGTAAAVTALALAAGVWLWPQPEKVHATATSVETPDDLSHLNAEARRWDGLDKTAIQMSSNPAIPGLTR